MGSNRKKGKPPDWLRVSKDDPCPVCGKPDWCLIAADGSLVRCMRKAEGAIETKQRKNGETYYVHQLHGADAAGEHEDNPTGAVDRADPETLDKVYSALLGHLALSDHHKDNLRQRGLNDQAIEEGGYGSLSKDARRLWAGKLLKQFGPDVLAGIPGFIKLDKGWTIAGMGLLIPVRDQAGKVVALSIRRDVVGPAESRYRWLSSNTKKHNGPSPGSPAHVPLGTPATAELVRLTEGALKADVIARLDPDKGPTIGLPGCAQWRSAVELLRGMKAKVVRLAFDADWCEKDTVAGALRACGAELVKLGFSVEVEVWPLPAGKGLDDVLNEGYADKVVVLPADKLGVGQQPEAGPGREPSQARRLIGLALAGLELFHTPDGSGYGTTKEQPHRTFKLDSKAAKGWLRQRLFEADDTVPNAATLVDVVNHLDGVANIKGEERPVFLRAAGAGSMVYLDLGNAPWQAVEIGPDGWRMVDAPPVRFRRAQGMLALPDPVRGGSLADLRPFVNVG
jgi:hypothetical protein